MNLNKRETATVLAALRYWQREGFISSGHERDIATDGDTLKEMTKDEIDDLCERINCDGDGDHTVLLAIQEMLDGVEWNADTVSDIAQLLIENGYRIRDLADVDIEEDS